VAFQNLQPIQPVDEIELAVVGAKDVVALDGVFSLATSAIKNFNALS